MAKVASQGVDLYWAADGSGPPLVMTHGFGSTSEIWQGQADALSDGFRVIRWDMRGHGRSASPDDVGRYDAAYTVQDMINVLDAAGEQRAVLVGFSLGGFMSLATWCAAPDRVTALVLCGTGPGYKKDSSRQQWNEHAERWAARLESGGLLALEADQDKASATTHSSARGLVLAARGMLPQFDSDVIDSLPRVDVPVLIVVGERDEPMLAGSAYMERKIPDAEIAIIPNAAHPVQLQQPDRFNQVLRDFLARVT